MVSEVIPVKGTAEVNLFEAGANGVDVCCPIEVEVDALGDGKVWVFLDRRSML